MRGTAGGGLQNSEQQYLFFPMAESRLRRELERCGVIDPENIELCSIDEAPMDEIMSSLSLEKEDIFPSTGWSWRWRIFPRQRKKS